MESEQVAWIFDASAITAYLQDEEGAVVVDELLTDPNTTCYAHSINLCEVYYDSVRHSSPKQADEIVSYLFELGIVERSDFDTRFWKAVGQLKAANKASLADLCGIVLSARLRGTFLTGDHHELDSFVAKQICSIRFIR